LIDPERAAQIEAIAADPAKYLDDKLTAIRPRTKELVTLALVRLAAQDPAAAATEAASLRWRAQLTAEERGWAWGSIGRRAAQRMQDDALAHFSRGDLAHMTDEHLAWMARA